MVLLPSAVTPEWLVMRPTRFPLTRCIESLSRTSMPNRTRPCAAAGIVDTLVAVQR